jgi:nucleotide-binding universal stress UspA family protein
MPVDERPAVVAYDGSDAAGAAVRTAAALLAGRPLVVVAVWEPAMAFAVSPTLDPSGLAYMPPRTEDVATIDRAQRDRAVGLAEAGARLARELGATAEPLAVSDEAAVADTIVAIAEQRDASVIVIGSRGVGRIKGLFGSTSRALLNHCDRPVLVVRAPH